ncbi:unnamed protein product [Caenorhabditis angaria]|uniref:Uncharacterized protein n=1 Tax=Caenorhabditis angaria TaxID=860376 RepID=A0A9P1I9L8_9PELO|nr:unnamed protein product [Caenorhabditis angaria]
MGKLGFLKKIDYKKKIKMRWYIRAAIGVLGLAHIGLGIWVAMQVVAEDKAVAPIKAALSRVGEKGYTDSNSQLKGVVMPFIVGVFCLLFAILQYHIMFYIIFLLLIIEFVCFIWSLISVFMIHKHQEAHYVLVEELEREMKKLAKKKHEEEQKAAEEKAKAASAPKPAPSRPKLPFGLDPIPIPDVDIPIVGGAINKVTGAVNAAGSDYFEGVHKFVTEFRGIIKNPEILVKELEKVVPLVLSFFGDSTEEMVRIVNKKPEVIKDYENLKKVINFGKIVAGVGMAVSVVSLFIVAALIVLHKPGGKFADATQKEEASSQKSDVTSLKNQSSKKSAVSKSAASKKSPGVSPAPSPLNNYPPPPQHLNNFGHGNRQQQYNPYV